MKDLNALETLFEEHGFAIELGGCGCCDSPWLKVAYKGELIFDGENAELSMKMPKPKKKS